MIIKIICVLFYYHHMAALLDVCSTLNAYNLYSFTPEMLDAVQWHGVAIRSINETRKNADTIIVPRNVPPPSTMPIPMHALPASDVVNSAATTPPSSQLLGADVVSSSSSSFSTPTPVAAQASSWFVPKQEDKLLWCAYIMCNGLDAYERITNYYCVGNDFKFKTVEMLRTQKTVLKPYKLSLTHVEEILTSRPFINMDGFMAIALLYNINFCYIDGRKMFEVQQDSEGKTHVMEKKKDYGLHLNSSESQLKEYRKTYWKMDNLESPLKALSSYKLQDLIDICERLKIPCVKEQKGEYGSIGTEKRKTKPELYADILASI